MLVSGLMLKVVAEKMFGTTDSKNCYFTFSRKQFYSSIDNSIPSDVAHKNISNLCGRQKKKQENTFCFQFSLQKKNKK